MIVFLSKILIALVLIAFFCAIIYAIIAVFEVILAIASIAVFFFFFYVIILLALKIIK